MCLRLTRGSACQTTLRQTCYLYSTFIRLTYIVVFIPARRTLCPKRIFLLTDSKKNGKPWVGTTGAGQNCPERESESLGEDGCMVSSVRSFLVQLFLNSIDRISDALGHAEHVMHLCTCKPCTVCRPITKKSTYLFSCAVARSISDIRNRVSVKHAQCQYRGACKQRPQTRLRRVPGLSRMFSPRTWRDRPQPRADASTTLSVETPKRLHRVRPSCPRVLSSSRCIFCRLPG